MRRRDFFRAAAGAAAAIAVGPSSVGMHEELAAIESDDRVLYAPVGTGTAGALTLADVREAVAMLRDSAAPVPSTYYAIY